jgi:hypothetical protein
MTLYCVGCKAATLQVACGQRLHVDRCRVCPRCGRHHEVTAAHAEGRGAPTPAGRHQNHES